MTQIDSFHIPALVTSIDAGAFETDSVSYISADALNNYYSTTDGVLFNRDKSELIFYPRHKSETEYVIPSSVISMSSFISCLNLVTVYMPASVIKIKSKQPFMNCNNLAELTVSDDNPKFKSINNVLFSKDLTKLIRYAPDQNGIKYIIPQQVEKIIDYAFSSAKKLERIEFSNSIDTIGNFGFYNCVMLDSVVFPESLKEIETGAFSNCTNLSELKYPTGVDSVGVDITVSCVQMDAVTISSSVSFFNYTNFNRCSDLDSIKLNAHTPPAVGTFDFNLIDTINATLYVPQGTMQAYSADPFWGAFTIAEFQFYLNTSGVSASLNDDAGNGEFDVVSNTEWSITTDQNWLHVNNEKGMDNDKVTFIVDANPGSDRQAIITINGFDLEPLFITVDQAGIETSTNGTVDNNQIKVFVLGSQLIVKNAKNQVITLYSITGTSMLSQKASSDYEELNISKFPSGVYLVKAGDQKVKISF
jgi:VCBS repeat-containing protein